jgi:hypothetical protein
MTARLLAIAGWLAAGHAVIAGLYWLLLAIPESNVAMLAASVLSAVVMALLFGWVEIVGLLAWQAGAKPRELPRRATCKVPGVWLGTALFVAVWFLVFHADDLWGGRRGEIDAWLMAEFGWTNTGGLHTAFRWLLTFLRFLGLSVSVALASAFAAGGFGALRHVRWLRDALSLRRLLTLAGILVVFFWLPWLAVDWRPAWLAPNWQETTFVVMKLGILYVLANIGSALILGVGTDYRTGARSHTKP